MSEYFVSDGTNYQTVDAMDKYVGTMRKAEQQGKSIAPLLASSLNNSLSNAQDAAGYMDPFRSRNMKAPQLQNGYNTLSAGYPNLSSRVVYYGNPGLVQFDDPSFSNPYGWDPSAYGNSEDGMSLYANTASVPSFEGGDKFTGNSDDYSDMYSYTGFKATQGDKYSIFDFRK